MNWYKSYLKRCGINGRDLAAGRRLTMGVSKLEAFLIALVVLAIIALCFFLGPKIANAADIPYNADQFCDAVYLAEGGPKSKKPYGVLSVPCDGEAECRQICKNSFRNNLVRFANQSRYEDFIDFFGSRWAPIGANNDPRGLNINWTKNVRYFLTKKGGNNQ